MCVYLTKSQAKSRAGINNYTLQIHLGARYIGIKKHPGLRPDNRTTLHNEFFFTCSEICPHDKVLELPKYTEEAGEVLVETRSYCDCVGCVGQKAICYCIDCGRSLCKFHNEVCLVIIVIIVII